MTKRQVIAILALVGIFIATYLTLHNLGYIGELSCSVGSCETVQTSRWSRLFGIPVALWGAGFYVSVLLLALLGESERFAGARWIDSALLAITGWGVLFSGWLTYLELRVIHAICMYCVISATLTTLIFLVAVGVWKEGRNG